MSFRKLLLKQNVYQYQQLFEFILLNWFLIVVIPNTF